MDQGLLASQALCVYRKGLALGTLVPETRAHNLECNTENNDASTRTGVLLALEGGVPCSRPFEMWIIEGQRWKVTTTHRNGRKRGEGILDAYKSSR